MPWFTSEVTCRHHTPIIFTNGLVKKDPRPLTGPELGLTDELDPAWFDAIDKHALPDDERVGVLREYVRGRGSPIYSCL